MNKAASGTAGAETRSERVALQLGYCSEIQARWPTWLGVSKDYHVVRATTISVSLRYCYCTLHLEDVRACECVCVYIRTYVRTYVRTRAV
jgi:hypothetical protein